MSHEIRTPMNAIVGMSDLLCEQEHSRNLNEEQLDYLHTIANAGEILLAIINDILDFSKIESGQFVLAEEPFNLKQCVENVRDILSVKAKEKNLRMPVRFSEGTPCRLIGDSRRLQQIIINLLNNSLKFTTEGSVTIAVSLAKKEEVEETEQVDDSVEAKPHRRSVTDNQVTILFKIIDTGIGISKDKLPDVFSAFRQVHTPEDKHNFYTGTGLGLTISKQLAGCMGGSMTVESQYGVGSTFSFTAIFNVDTSEVAQPTTPRKIVTPRSLKPTASLRILVAEDNIVNQKVTGRMLSRLGYEFDMVKNGLEAVNMLAKKDYDVILMDVHMPVMGGMEASKQCRSLAKFKDSAEPPIIIALTAEVLGEVRAECQNAGMNGYLSKPLTMAELKKMLATVEKGAVQTTFVT
eukprot:TRINITY_DN4180_c0_g2_i1.p1 TRINITY_DN4180_c0_g2~~TRINITY_DN4180_c0_g2_i1.p1  ORF type:complete len:449 (+),score=84.97 TRINITY_DN4180_c0_g2_i1:128-1348(+)